MSDEQQQPEQFQVAQTEQPGDKWGDPISEQRQAELKWLAERQREWVGQPEATRGDSVFKGVQLTGADVLWLAEDSGRGDWTAERRKYVGSTRSAILHESHLWEAANYSVAI